ncbi:hypothetical protein MJO28_014222 [Puccinia striiformis f. sp. tritici]|uniref:Uncharacterized protein n=1 Tax=Puccinia striiformis f. sp. tritici TaxID=168172 RepID=A0ACC0DSZ3_9BASI|nr:hypothetical protein MJO28_014222 [Puccinia striiformis f. sp. tritici]
MTDWANPSHGATTMSLLAACAIFERVWLHVRTNIQALSGYCQSMPILQASFMRAVSLTSPVCIWVRAKATPFD